MEAPKYTRYLVVFGVLCAFFAVIYRTPIAAHWTHSVLPLVFYKTNPELPELARDLRTTNDIAAPGPTASSAFPEHLIGLHVVHEPRREQNTVNLIFVHGLGGSAKGTWTHSSKTFWPTLLHDDDRFTNVRISIFGYKADFNNVFEPKNTLGITDFAKQLLDCLDLYYDKYGDVRNMKTI
jgi:hypothetical protein